MKKIFKSVLFTFVLAVVSSLPGFSYGFSDISYWVGSGSNSAALAIDWNDGKTPETLVWGYHWNGNATGRDMLNAIKSVDSRLFEPNDAYGGGTVYGLGYDLDNDGFSYIAGDDDTGHAADSDDHYIEGWMSAGYWSYWLKSDDSSDWGYAMEGLSTRKLTDGCWDGWVFAASPTWDGGKPDNLTAATKSTEAVPEPSSIAFSIMGLVSIGGLVLRKRK